MADNNSTRRARTNAQRARANKPMENPTDRIIQELSKINSNIGNQGTRIVASLLKGSRGTSTSAYQDTEAVTDAFVTAATNYYEQSGRDQSKIVSGVDEIRANIVKYVEMMVNEEKNSQKQRSDRWDQEDQASRQDKQVEDAKYRETIRRESVRDKGLIASLKGIYTNTLVPIFSAGFNQMVQSVTQMNHEINSGYRQMMEQYGTKGMTKKEMEEAVARTLNSTNREVSVQNVQEALMELRKLGLTEDRAKTMMVKVGNSNMNLADFLARASDTGLEMNRDDLSYAIKTNNLQSWVNHTMGTWGARRNAVEESSINDAESALSSMKFDSTGSEFLAQRSRTRNKMLAQTQNMHATQRQAYYDAVQSVLNMTKSPDQVNGATLGLVFGKDNGQELLKLIQSDKAGNNTERIIEVVNKAINRGELLKDMSKMTSQQRGIMSDELGLDVNTIDQFAKLPSNTYSQATYNALNNIEENTADWLRVSRENNPLTEDQTQNMLMRWADKLGLTPALNGLGKILANPTYGGFATQGLSFLTASMIPKILGLAGKGLIGGVGMLGKGITSAPELIGKGASFLGNGVLDALFPLGEQMSMAGKAVKFGGAALAGATMAYDGITAAMDPRAMGMHRDDATSRASAGIGAALGGKGKGFSDGILSGFAGAASGALKGAALGTMFGPVGTVIGGAIGATAGAIGGQNISKFIDGSIDLLVDSWTWMCKNFNQLIADLGTIGKITFLDNPMAMLKTLLNVGKLVFIESPYNTFKVVTKMLESAGLSISILLKSGMGAAVKGLMGLLDPIASKIPGVNKMWAGAKDAVNNYFGTKDEEARLSSAMKEVGDFSKKQLNSTIHAFDPLTDQLKSNIDFIKNTPNRYKSLDPNERNSFKRDKAQRGRDIANGKSEQALMPNVSSYEYEGMEQKKDAKYQNDQLYQTTNTLGTQLGYQKKLWSTTDKELPKQTELLTSQNDSLSRLKVSIDSLASRLDKIVTNTTPSLVGTSTPFSTAGITLPNAGLSFTVDTST